MTADLVPVPVPGADTPLQAVQIDGRPFVALRPLCDSLGIDFSGQLTRLKAKSWATVEIRPMVAADGKVRDVAMIDRRTMTMWLATVSENKVAPKIRPLIITYQREAADALDSYFNASARPTTIDGIRAMLDQIEAAQRDAADAKALAQRTDDRLAAIEGRHDWLSALAYARINNLLTNTRFLQKLGSCASRIARTEGVEPNKVQHQLFGTVNSYPVWVWDLAAEGFDA